MSKTKPSTSFEILGYFLGQYGEGKLTREQFWKEMNARGYTQESIDKWCDDFYILEAKKDQDNEARRKETEGRTARAATARDARGPRREEQGDYREERQGDEQSVQRQRPASQDEDARQEDRDGEARKKWKIVDGDLWVKLDQSHCDFVDPIAMRRLEISIDRGADDEGRPYEERVRSTIDGHRGEAATRIFFGTDIPWSINHLVVDGPFEAKLDFSDFIDVKTRSKDYHTLMIDLRYWKPDIAYLLVCAAKHPHYRIIGWCWGHEAASDDRLKERRKGRPAYWVEASDPILKSPFDLRALALERKIE